MKAIKPQVGQESVWDYPRPPRVEPAKKRVRIYLAGICLVDSKQALRVLETSHPPTYYVPQSDIQMSYLFKTPKTSFCEFKGQASYWSVQLPEQKLINAAWSYPEPGKGYEGLKDYLAFYPGKMDKCLLDDELVTAQEGDFYGGWISKDIVGPFKGAPGTWGW